MNTLTTILLSCIGSSGLFAFLQFLINRHDKNDELHARLDKIEANQHTAEKDSVRTQLLIMMNHYPEDTSEILKLAEYYFKNLHGNWYLTALFGKWLAKKNIEIPEWFEKR